MGIDNLIALRDEFRKQPTTKEEHKKRYLEYLQSNEWFAKRAKVLDRDQYICQGCLSKTATQVHHLTYDNVFNEFLWQLVSICEECHKRKHNKTN